MKRAEANIHKALGTWDSIPEFDRHVCEENSTATYLYKIEYHKPTLDHILATKTNAYCYLKEFTISEPSVIDFTYQCHKCGVWLGKCINVIGQELKNGQQRI